MAEPAVFFVQWVCFLHMVTSFDLEMKQVVGEIGYMRIAVDIQLVELQI